METALTLPEPDEVGSEEGGRTITLSESDVECAVRLLHLITGEEQPAAIDVGDDGRTLLRSRAEKIVKGRRLRTQYFNRAIFGEAAWDILLLLYVADPAGSRQTQTKLSKGLATPASTIQRWLDYLEKERLIRRDPHPTDRRTSFVSLMDKGREALESYLAAIAE